MIAYKDLEDFSCQSHFMNTEVFESLFGDVDSLPPRSACTSSAVHNMTYSISSIMNLASHGHKDKKKSGQTNPTQKNTEVLPMQQYQWYHQPGTNSVISSFLQCLGVASPDLDIQRLKRERAVKGQRVSMVVIDITRCDCDLQTQKVLMGWESRLRQSRQS